MVEPRGEHGTAPTAPNWGGCLARGCQAGAVLSLRGAGGSALWGTGRVAKAGVFPACLYVTAPESPGSQEQAGTEGHICLINGFVAKPAQWHLLIFSLLCNRAEWEAAARLLGDPDTLPLLEIISWDKLLV